MDLTIIISHTKDLVYLYHNIDILRNMGFNKENIWIDGYKSGCEKLVGDVSKVTTHNEHHGARCFDLLTEASSEYVIIMDSDFFCNDRDFWQATLEMVKIYPFVSISKSWWLSIQLTTPFVAYQRKTALEMAPVRASWNHFSLNFPDTPDPVFDSLQYVFFMALKKGNAIGVDDWNLQKRKYKFCHLWDSRHSYEQNFKDFENTSIDRGLRYQYLAFGVCKHIFQYVAGIVPLEHRIWDYMEDIKTAYPKEWLYIEGAMKYMDFQISFKPQWLERFNTVNKLYERDLKNV